MNIPVKKNVIFILLTIFFYMGCEPSSNPTGPNVMQEELKFTGEDLIPSLNLDSLKSESGTCTIFLSDTFGVISPFFYKEVAWYFLHSEKLELPHRADLIYSLVVSNAKHLKTRTIIHETKVSPSLMAKEMAYRNTSLGYWEFLDEVISRADFRLAEIALRDLLNTYLDHPEGGEEDFYRFILVAGFDSKFGNLACEKLEVLQKVKRAFDTSERGQFYGDVLGRLFKKWPPCKAMST